MKRLIAILIINIFMAGSVLPVELSSLDTVRIKNIEKQYLKKEQNLKYIKIGTVVVTAAALSSLSLSCLEFSCRV